MKTGLKPLLISLTLFCLFLRLFITRFGRHDLLKSDYQGGQVLLYHLPDNFDICFEVGVHNSITHSNNLAHGMLPSVSLMPALTRDAASPIISKDFV